jgi:radical SAM superfamily enzyme YgiQ (UPF0313 family)
MPEKEVTSPTVLVASDSSDVPPERFYQRFNPFGEILNPNWQRITTEESERLFPHRDKGLKLLLINPPIREWSYPNIMPLGQGYVAAVAVMDGHHVDVLDLNALRKYPVKDSPEVFSMWVESQVLQKLLKQKPDVIAIGGIITQYKRIKEIAQLCKQVYPEVPIALGGGIASALPDFMVARLPIDIVMQGEGEITISELLHRLETGSSLKGLQGVAYKEIICAGEWQVINNGWRASAQRLHKGMDFLPWPMRSLWALDDVYKQNPVGHLNWKTKWLDGKSAEPNQYSVSMIASRGCPYGAKACDYCFATYLGKQYRLRTPKEVVDEMEYLKQRYQVTYIHFLDDLMLADPRWALSFCEELRQRRKQTGFEVMWGATCRTNIVADDVLRSRRQGRPSMLEQAYEVGMRQAGYGVETASPKILESIDKSGQTVEKIEISIEETKRVMGYADCSFMIGSPGETRETVQETVDVCRKIGLQPEVFFFTTAYPGTTFWQLVLDMGLIRKAVTGEKGPADDDIIEQYFLKLGEQGESVRTNFSDLPDEEIEELSWWAINELKAQNTVRHPTQVSPEDRKMAVRGASKADL